MLLMPRSCFLHIPKTGGTWVKNAIIASGIPAREFNIDGNPHIGYKYCPEPEKYMFAFVRHPLAFYRSYWLFKMTDGWDPKNVMDNECKSNDFNIFIANVLSKYPQIYSKFVFSFIGYPEQKIRFVGRFENLVEDLIKALNEAGEEFDESVIQSFPPVNVSNKSRHSALYSSEQKQQILENEAHLMKTFGYQ